MASYSSKSTDGWLGEFLWSWRSSPRSGESTGQWGVVSSSQGSRRLLVEWGDIRVNRHLLIPLAQLFSTGGNRSIPESSGGVVYHMKYILGGCPCADLGVGRSSEGGEGGSGSILAHPVGSRSYEGGRGLQGRALGGRRKSFDCRGGASTELTVLIWVVKLLVTDHAPGKGGLECFSILRIFLLLGVIFAAFTENQKLSFIYNSCCI